MIDLLLPQNLGTCTFGSVTMSGRNGGFVSCGSTKNRFVMSDIGSCCPAVGASAGSGFPAQSPHQWFGEFAASGGVSNGEDQAPDNTRLAARA